MRWLILLLFASSAWGAEPIPSGQVIDWDPGVRGGIPERTVVYTNYDNTATTAEIQGGLNTCPSNQVVMLTNKVFAITASLLPKPYVTLRGHGVSNTVIRPSGAISGNCLVRFENTFDEEWGATARTITGSPAKGATNFTTSAAHGWTVGDIVLVDMLEDPAGDPPISNQGSLGTATWVGRESGTRPFGQWVKVLSVPSTTEITFEPPLYWTYTNTAQAIEMTGILNYAGVEDMSLDNLSSAEQDTVVFEGAVNCWLRDVEVKGNFRRAMWVYGGLWLEVRRCWIVGGVPIGTDNSAAYDSDRSYGPFLGPHCTAALFTDSIFEKLTMGIAFEGAVAGNVFSYNLITNIWWKSTGDSPRRFGPLMHGPHPFMNLIEGNYSCGRIRADEYWGTSSHFVSFRNRVIQIDRGASDAQTWTVDIERKNWYWSFVANLLGGSPGVEEDNYEYINGEAAPYSTSVSTIWKLGYESLGEDNTLYDTDGFNSTLRWANWSHRTNDSTSGSGIVWHTANVVDTGNLTNFAASYYLDSKPSFMGAMEWPPYDITDPDDNSVTNIPAGHRYFLGAEAPSEGGGEPAAGPMAGGALVTGGAVRFGRQ